MTLLIYPRWAPKSVATLSSNCVAVCVSGCNKFRLIQHLLESNCRDYRWVAKCMQLQCCARWAPNGAAALKRTSLQCARVCV